MSILKLLGAFLPSAYEERFASSTDVKYSYGQQQYERFVSKSLFREMVKSTNLLVCDGYESLRTPADIHLAQ